MDGYDAAMPPFRYVWPLHACRYGLIFVGVVTWLFEHTSTGGVLAGALLLSTALLIDLPLHSPGGIRKRHLWANLQLVVAVAAYYATPGLPLMLVLCAVLLGIAVVLPLGGLIAGGVLVTLATTIAPVAEGASAMPLQAIALYSLSSWGGHQFRVGLRQRQEHKRTVEALKAAQDRISLFAEATRELAAAEERQRLSEEMHDTLGHALVATLLQVQVAKRMSASDPAGAQERLERVEQNVRQTLERVRGTLRHSRYVQAQHTLPRALERLAKDFQAAGGPRIDLSFHPDDESVADVSNVVADVLYRATQESLTNAVRHGQARHIRIQAESVGPRLYLRISDDGIGADVYSPGMGLTGMVSRVQSVGGTLRFRTAAGEGFHVEIGVKRR